jgi:hypothetical protein|tara:strand:+ start:21453 stop:21665 length:213 start_codon:yes stop_codon:yes gene_type:complete
LNNFILFFLKVVYPVTRFLTGAYIKRAKSDEDLDKLFEVTRGKHVSLTMQRLEDREQKEQLKELWKNGIQ